MNFVNFLFRIRKRVIRACYLLLFFLKKPFYILSYNTNGNQFKCDGYLYNGHILMSGSRNKLIIQKGVRLNNTYITIGGRDNTLIIGKDVVFSEGGRVKIEHNNNFLEIGGNTRIINAFFVLGDNNTKMTIGENCLFSAAVIIRNDDGHSIVDESGNRINYPKDTTIGNHVWIGYGVNVLKGTIIGNDCVVGTKSVLTGKTFPDKCLIAGSPAKVIKEGINWDSTIL